MNQDSSSPDQNRLYYFDWLRVIAFSLLLFVHCAEIFVSWKFWIKNNETSQALTLFTAFFLPWRMPILFIISGAVVTSSFQRKRVGAFLKERMIRLLLPLVFAIFFVIPPQIYFIRKYRGIQESFVEFYKQIIHLEWDLSPKGNVHVIHLWYLAFLLIYSVLFLPVLHYLRYDKGKAVVGKLAALASGRFSVLYLGMLVNLPYYVLSRLQPLSDYPSMFIYYFPLFACGVLLWSDSTFRNSLSEKVAFVLCGACITTSILYYLSFKTGDPEYYFYNLSRSNDPMLFILKASNQWFWVVGIFGLAKRFLNFSSSLLSQTTTAVYPFYILHQTLIVAFGYYIIQMDLSLFYKLALVTLLTFVSMLIFYVFLIKRLNWIAIVFGVKPAALKR